MPVFPLSFFPLSLSNWCCKNSRPSRTVPSASMHSLGWCRKDFTTIVYSLTHTVCLQFHCFVATLNTLLLLLWPQSNYPLIYSGDLSRYFFFFPLFYFTFLNTIQVYPVILLTKYLLKWSSYIKPCFCIYALDNWLLRAFDFFPSFICNPSIKEKE